MSNLEIGDIVVNRQGEECVRILNIVGDQCLVLWHRRLKMTESVAYMQHRLTIGDMMLCPIQQKHKLIKQLLSE